MKKILFLILMQSFLLSCKIDNKGRLNVTDSPKKLAKLEGLLLLAQDSIIDTYDLSNDSIRLFPDLSKYKIKSLNLSYNLLDTFIVGFLPQKLEKLNLSHNQIQGDLTIGENSMPNLKELDVSYNKLESLDILESLFRIIASYNDLTDIQFKHGNIYYLDISYNIHLSNHVGFYPAEIDTIIREGVADGKPLVSPLDFWSTIVIE